MSCVCQPQERLEAGKKEGGGVGEGGKLLMSLR